MGNYSIEAQALFTTDLYANNPNAPAIHVRISELPQFIEETKSSTFSTYVSMTYEVISQYLKDALSLLIDINSPHFKRTREKGLGPEEELQNAIAKAKYLPLDVADVATLTYYRHRRNHIIHQARSISPKFVAFIASEYATLEQHWDGSASKQDFSSHDIFSFSEQEAIEAIKILRIVFQRIDTHIASLLDNNALAEHVARDLFSATPQRINASVVKKRVSKLKKHIKHVYDLEPSHVSLEEAARKYGAK
ncbi:MAG: hypothetical protein ACE37I_05205 [Rubinisphaera brasiliensis]|uniref:hypothetical protein n=1 Tax=Rubinisphaera brasiliensis TaxID=119 RepID=UPI003919872F